MHSLNTHEDKVIESESESVKEEEKSLEEESSSSEEAGDLEKTKEEPVKKEEKPQVIPNYSFNRRNYHEPILRLSSFTF